MHIWNATHFHPFSAILAHFHPVLLHVLCYSWMVDCDDGESPAVMYFHNATNRQVGCYTLLSLGNNVCILFMSHHLKPPSALLDHRESVAWLISNGPHSAAYCYKLGPIRVKAECLCPQKAATIFQHTQATTHCAWPRPPTTRSTH